MTPKILILKNFWPFKLWNSENFDFLRILTPQNFDRSKKFTLPPFFTPLKVCIVQCALCIMNCSNGTKKVSAITTVGNIIATKMATSLVDQHLILVASFCRRVRTTYFLENFQNIWESLTLSEKILLVCNTHIKSFHHHIWWTVRFCWYI